MRNRPSSRRLQTLVLCLVVLLTAVKADAQGPTAGESFHYRWRLTRLLGLIAGLFFPREGDGVLSLSRMMPGSTLRSELKITSGEAKGDFYLYASELDPTTGRTLHAWSSYSWRGEANSREGRIDESGVIDVASGIYLLRQQPPDKPKLMEIWSDGKLYPVVVVPIAEERRRVAGRQIETRHLSIRGVDQVGRPQWNAKLDLWLAKDGGSTPVEIRLDRRGAALHLEMVSW